MFLSTTTVASGFDNPLLIALFKQMLKMFLHTCEAWSVVLFREQFMNWFTGAWTSAV